MKSTPSLLQQHLDYLKLPFAQNHPGELARQAAEQQWDHVEYLRRLMEGEYNERRQRVIERRIKAARFPVIKTLEQFRWDWPKKFNHAHQLIQADAVSRRGLIQALVPHER